MAFVGMYIALLEARGLRPELLDALGARGMHHIFGRLPPGSGTSGTMTRINQLMTGIEATHDETLQLQSAIELCQVGCESVRSLHYSVMFYLVLLYL